MTYYVNDTLISTSCFIFQIHISSISLNFNFKALLITSGGLLPNKLSTLNDMALSLAKGPWVYYSGHQDQGRHFAGVLRSYE